MKQEKSASNPDPSFTKEGSICLKGNLSDTRSPPSGSVPQTNPGSIEKRIGVAKGKFIAPDDIDEFNDEIAKMFGVE